MPNPNFSRPPQQNEMSRDGIVNKDDLLKANIVRASGASLRNLQVAITASISAGGPNEHALTEMPDEPEHNSP